MVQEGLGKEYTGIFFFFFFALFLQHFYKFEVFWNKKFYKCILLLKYTFKMWITKKEK